MLIRSRAMVSWVSAVRRKPGADDGGAKSGSHKEPRASRGLCPSLEPLAQQSARRGQPSGSGGWEATGCREPCTGSDLFHSGGALLFMADVEWKMPPVLSRTKAVCPRLLTGVHPSPQPGGTRAHRATYPADRTPRTTRVPSTALEHSTRRPSTPDPRASAARRARRRRT